MSQESMRELVISWYKKKTGKTHGAQAAFAVATSTEPSLLSRHMTGVINPERDSLEKYAKELGISVPALSESLAIYRSSPEARGAIMREKLEATRINSAERSQFLPVLTVITSDTFPLDLDQPACGSLPLPATGKHFALRVKGDALAPHYKHGQYLLAARASVVPPNMPAIYHLGKLYTIRAAGAGGALKALAIILGVFSQPWGDMSF